MRDPTCVVTGGAGFIGSHLVDALVRTGRTVRVLDDFSTGRVTDLRAAMRSGRVEIVRGSVKDLKTVTKTLQSARVVFHLAALTDHRVAVNNPLLLNATNVTGTLNLLNVAVKSHVECFVFASSAAVYGESGHPSMAENAPANPINPYGASKLASESYCRAFQRTYGVDTVCLRYFNVYGSRQRASGEAAVIPEFLKKIRERKPLRIRGTGHQVRDFIHVDDVVNATLLAAEKQRASGRVLNVGTGTPTSILALAKQLLVLTGQARLRKLHLSSRPGDIMRSCAETSKASEILGFCPKVSLEDGLRSLIVSENTLARPGS